MKKSNLIAIGVATVDGGYIAEAVVSIGRVAVCSRLKPVIRGIAAHGRLQMSLHRGGRL